MTLRKRRIEQLGLSESKPQSHGQTEIDAEDFLEGIERFSKRELKSVLLFERIGRMLNGRVIRADVEFAASIFKEAVIAAGEDGKVLVNVATNDHGILMLFSFSAGMPDLEGIINLTNAASDAGFKCGNSSEVFFVEINHFEKKSTSLRASHTNSYLTVLQKVFYC